MQYTYTLTTELQSTKDVEVWADGQPLYTINRVYSNGLKKLFDGYFDYRYFLRYEVKNEAGELLADCKKVQRKGKLWFEAYDRKSNQPYIINYENWRIGVPELFVKGPDFSMKIDKEMEDWSNFIVNETIVARWLAVYQEQTDTFDVVLEVHKETVSPALLLAIAQTTLFIGA